MTRAGAVDGERSRTAIRRLLPLFLVTALAALVPLVGGASAAGASTAGARSAAVSAAGVATPAKSLGSDHRRSARPATRTGPAAAHRRVDAPDGTVRRDPGQRSGDRLQPAPPATSASDPTGPPSADTRAAGHRADRWPAGRAPIAAAGRSPPLSCGT